MSFNAYRQYLTDIYRSPATGKPLQRDSAGDYVSRLRNLQNLLRVDLEHASPTALRQLLGSLRSDPVVLHARSAKFVGDVAPAIRLYAEFLESSENTGVTVMLLAADRLKSGLDAGPSSDPVGLLHDAVATIQTEVQSIIDARRGQQRFRAELFRYWHGTCALTDIDRGELLRASHIKPWSVSSDTERVDPFNGLLLAVHADALFDRALISFGEAGEMLVSDRLSEREQALFGLLPPRRTVPLTAAHQGYMQHHRERFSTGL
jgi:hypothetical protein